MPMSKDAAIDRDIAELVGQPAVHVRRNSNLGPLHDLLLKACPPDANNTVSISILARQIDHTPQGLQRWISRNSIPPKKAKMIVELSQARTDVGPEGKVSLADFSPFIFD
jgi:hypothetical protein